MGISHCSHKCEPIDTMLDTREETPVDQLSRRLVYRRTLPQLSLICDYFCATFFILVIVIINKNFTACSST